MWWRCTSNVIYEGNINRALCTNGYPGHVGLEARCRGYKDTMEAAVLKLALLVPKVEQQMQRVLFHTYFQKS